MYFKYNQYLAALHFTLTSAKKGRRLVGDSPCAGEWILLFKNPAVCGALPGDQFFWFEPQCYFQLAILR